MSPLMSVDQKNIPEALPRRRPKRVLFLAYQRTVFVDALRTASCLKDVGDFEPLFLVPVETAQLLEREMAECRRRGIACLTDTAVLSGHRGDVVDPVPPDHPSEARAQEPEPIALQTAAVERRRPPWLAAVLRTVGLFLWHVWFFGVMTRMVAEITWVVIERKLGEGRFKRILKGLR